MGSLELSPSLTLGLMEYLDDNAAIYPSSTSVEGGRLPEAPMEIALSEDILKYLGFEGSIGDKITLSLQKIFATTLRTAIPIQRNLFLQGY